MLYPRKNGHKSKTDYERDKKICTSLISSNAVARQYGHDLIERQYAYKLRGDAILWLGRHGFCCEEQLVESAEQVIANTQEALEREIDKVYSLHYPEDVPNVHEWLKARLPHFLCEELSNAVLHEHGHEPQVVELVTKFRQYHQETSPEQLLSLANMVKGRENYLKINMVDPVPQFWNKTPLQYVALTVLMNNASALDNPAPRRYLPLLFNLPKRRDNGKLVTTKIEFVNELGLEWNTIRNSLRKAKRNFRSNLGISLREFKAQYQHNPKLHSSIQFCQSFVDGVSRAIK